MQNLVIQNFKIRPAYFQLYDNNKIIVNQSLQTDLRAHKIFQKLSYLTFISGVT